MTSKVKKNILKLKESSTLAINEKSKELIKSGKKIYRFGFGQSPFQIPERVIDTLKLNAHKKQYLPIQGLPELREKISNHLFKNTGVRYSKDNILITPGSKEASLDPGVIKILSFEYLTPVFLNKWFEIFSLSSGKPCMGKYCFLCALSFSVSITLSGI